MSLKRGPSIGTVGDDQDDEQITPLLLVDTPSTTPHLPNSDTPFNLDQPIANPSSPTSIYSLTTLLSSNPNSLQRPTELTTPPPQSPSLLELNDSVLYDEDSPGSPPSSSTEELQKIPWYKRPSVWWLVPLLMIYLTVMGTLVGPVDQVFIEVICQKHFLEHGEVTQHRQSMREPVARCREPDVQGYSALIHGRVFAIVSLIAFFTIGYWTSLADRYGRRLLISAAILPFSIYVASLLFMRSEYNVLPGTGLLYVVAIARGAFGGGMLLDGAVVSYISDCTSSESRSRIIGQMVVVVSLSTIVGSLIGGYIIERSGGDMTLLLKLGAIAGPLAVLYCMFILPESLHLKVKNATEDDGVEDSSPDSLSTATSTECDQTVQSAAPLPRRIFEMLKVMLAPLQLFIPGRLEMIEDSSVVKLPSRYSLILLVISRALLEMASNGVDSLMIPYTNVEFNWVHDMDAIFIAFTGFTSLVVFVAIFPVCQKLYKKFIIKLGRTKSVALSFSTGSDDDENEDTWEGGPEDSDGFSSSELLGDRSSGSTPRNSPEAKEDQNRHFEIDYHFYLMGILVTTVGFMLVPIYRTEAVYFTGAALSVLGSVANVTFMSMITAVVPAQWTSKLLGGVTVAVTVAVSIGLVLYGWVFAQTAATWPSFYFCIATLTTVVSFIVGSSALMWLPRQLVSSPMLV